MGDPRRTDRLLKVASALAANPSASLPQALGTWGETQGAYRLLSLGAISYREILGPHWSQVYHEAHQVPRTLLLADATEFDFATHRALKGRGPMGNSKEDIGFSLHTVLAMEPETQQILGCITLEPFLRKLAPPGKLRPNGRSASESRKCGNTVCNRSGRSQRATNGSTWEIVVAMSTRFGKPVRTWAMTLSCGWPKIVTWTFPKRMRERGWINTCAGYLGYLFEKPRPLSKRVKGKKLWISIFLERIIQVASTGDVGGAWTSREDTFFVFRTR